MLYKAVREKINEQKQEKWKEFVSGIEADTKVATSFWKKVKSYSNSCLNPNFGKVTNLLVMEDGNIATTNKLTLKLLLHQ